MKFGIPIGVILALAIFASTSLALNTNIYSSSERNLSIDLGPGYDVTQKNVDNCSGGYFVQDLMITNADSSGLAILHNGSLRCYPKGYELIDSVRAVGSGNDELCPARRWNKCWKLEGP